MCLSTGASSYQVLEPAKSKIVIPTGSALKAFKSQAYAVWLGPLLEPLSAQKLLVCNKTCARVSQIILGVPTGTLRPANSSGAITLVLAALVLLFPAVAVFVIVFWLSISLLFGGIDDMIVGIGAEVEESYLEITGSISFMRKKEQMAAVT